MTTRGLREERHGGWGKGRAVAVVLCAAMAAFVLAACGSSSNTSAKSSGGGSVNWSTVTSAKAAGGMAALVKAAKQEGKLNAIALPSNWANYGKEISTFENKYGIKVNVANPSGSSAEEIAAIKDSRGRSSAPDVVDVGQSFATTNTALFAPYKVATWNMIPAANKASDGSWFNDYGGYMSFGCDMNVVSSCPITWAALKDPAYKHDVALNGVPGEASAATAAVQAAALNNGGSFANIQPGLDFFKELKQNGNFNSTDCDSSSLIEGGQCPIVINWDFLNVAGAWGLSAKTKWKVVDPDGASFAEYYAQAISKDAPDPAAARLWEEFLYSSEGQNIWLQGHARPVELAAMAKAGTVDQAAYKQLPAVKNVAKYPTNKQSADAATAIAAGWPKI